MAEQLPVWHNPGVEPPDSLKNTGWQPGVKPAAQHMNWLLNRTYNVLKALQENGDLTQIEQDLSELETKVAKHLDESKVSAHKAKNIALEDTEGLFVGTELETAMKELFTNVSNGKALIGTAITDIDKSTVVPINPTFQQLAELIKNISSMKRWATGTVRSGSQLINFQNNNGGNQPTYGLTVTGLNFTAKTILVTNNAGVQLIGSYSEQILNQYNGYYIANSNGTNYRKTGSFVINSTGFTFPVGLANESYTWMAIE